MIFKLLTSFAIAIPLVAALSASSQETVSLLAIGLVVLIAGYHRNYVDEAGRIPFGRIVLPTMETMRVRHSIWGFPLANSHRVRISRPMRERAESARVWTTALECLPALLRWLARKAAP